MALQGDGLLCRYPTRTQMMFINICAVTMLLWLFFYGFTDTDVKVSTNSLEPWKISHFLNIAVNKMHRVISIPKKPRKRKLVVLWTKYFNDKNWLPSTETLQCPVSECDVTSNRSLLLNSSAVILHWRDIDVQDLPNCVPSDDTHCPGWVLFNKEAPPHTREDILAAIQDDVQWTAMYRRDSNLFAPYGIIEPQNELNYEKPDFYRKKRLLCWLVSNCNTPSKRELFVSNLSYYAKVDVYGQCGDLKCPHRLVLDCYQWLSKRCKFYLSLENSNCKDYITEKLFYALSSGMVPVVFGNNSNYHFLPPRSYISAEDFSGPKELADYLVRVGKDKDLYLSYFRWKKNYKVTDYSYKWFCELCEKLHGNNNQSMKSRTDLTSWWFDQSECTT